MCRYIGLHISGVFNTRQILLNKKNTIEKQFWRKQSKLKYYSSIGWM